jgi:hypothetical protein
MDIGYSLGHHGERLETERTIFGGSGAIVERDIPENGHFSAPRQKLS